MSRPRKNRNPDRCKLCGALCVEFPEGWQICYPCWMQRDKPSREQRYILDVPPVQTIGCVTSQRGELLKPTRMSNLTSVNAPQEPSK